MLSLTAAAHTNFKDAHPPLLPPGFSVDATAAPVASKLSNASLRRDARAACDQVAPVIQDPVTKGGDPSGNSDACEGEYRPTAKCAYT